MSKGKHKFTQSELGRAWRAVQKNGGGGKVRIDPESGALEIVPVADLRPEPIPEPQDLAERI